MYENTEYFERTSFGPIYFYKNLYYYDGPLMSLGIDDKGRNWLCEVMDDNRETKIMTYMCVAIDRNERSILLEAAQYKDIYILEKIFLNWTRLGIVVDISFDEETITERLATKADFDICLPKWRKS